MVYRSGHETLSVIDVRTKKSEPLAQSEDQEDELLSILPIRGSVCSLALSTIQNSDLNSLM